MVKKIVTNRYNRQELLKEVGKNGQALLKKSSIAIIGVGALGTTVANLLARAGVGTIALVDRDVIELHNLQRQTIFTEEDCNKPKAVQAKVWLQKVNSEITIEAFPEEINYETIILLKKYDLILDCTDNMETRFLINDFCIKENKPWIYCSAVATKGRMFVVDPRSSKFPCFRCIFTLPKPGALETCDTAGVLNTITAAMAAMQTTEAIKILTKQQPTKELVAYDIWTQTVEKITVKKKKDCMCCQKRKFEFLEGKGETVSIKLCGQGRIQVKGKRPNTEVLETRLKKAGATKRSAYGIQFHNEEADFFLFTDGRCLIKAATKEEAKNAYSKYVGN